MASIQCVRKEEKQVVDIKDEAAKVDAIIKQAETQFSDDIINQSMAIVQRNERLDVDDYDDHQVHHFAASSLGSQQPNLDFGQPNLGFGQTNQGFGQPNLGFRHGNMGYGEPNQGFGQPNLGFRQGNTGNGQPNLVSGQSNLGFRQGNMGNAKPNLGFGPFGQQRGKAKPKPQPQPKPQQKLNITVVAGTLKNQSKGPMRVIDAKKWAGHIVMDYPNPLNNMGTFAQSALSFKGVKAAVVYAGKNSAGYECAWLLAWSDSKSAGTRVYAACGPKRNFDKVNWDEVEQKLASASRSVANCSDNSTGTSVYATLVGCTGKDILGAMFCG